MKKGRILITSGLLLIAAALSLTGYNLLDTKRAGEASEAALQELLPIIEERSGSEGTGQTGGFSGDFVYPDHILNPEMDMPTEEIDGEAYLGVISIPAIDRELPVFAEWNYSNLKNGPCRYAGSAYLDDMVICAHNYTIHFGPIWRLVNGDRVTFTDVDGNVFKYKVTETLTLQPMASNEMKTGDWDLTLFTCTLGGASRITVRCERIEE